MRPKLIPLAEAAQAHREALQAREVRRLTAGIRAAALAMAIAPVRVGALPALAAMPAKLQIIPLILG